MNEYIVLQAIPIATIVLLVAYLLCRIWPTIGWGEA
jgi:hypothetical protein